MCRNRFSLAGAGHDVHRERCLLAGAGRLGEHLLAHVRRGRHRRDGGEPAGRLPQAAGLLAAGLAPGEVPLEPHPVRLGERVKRVRAGQGVRDLPPDPHESSPRQSRSRISPSRMRVFTVPTATPSRPATSR